MEKLYGNIHITPNTIIPRAQKYSTYYFGILGDLNSDGNINILDTVALVNIALTTDYNVNGDMNQDEDINVLDVIILVNLILESPFF